MAIVSVVMRFPCDFHASGVEHLFEVRQFTRAYLQVSLKYIHPAKACQSLPKHQNSKCGPGTQPTCKLNASLLSSR